MAATSDDVRVLGHTQLCDIECNGVKLGYAYCGYRDCSWDDGDYEQKVSKCSNTKQSRTVSYDLLAGELTT
jgi:hypothetical protein